jgi:hypothetical protein
MNFQPINSFFLSYLIPFASYIFTLTYRHSPPLYPTHNLHITYHQHSNPHNQWQFRINYSGLRFDYLIKLVMKFSSINQRANDLIRLAYAVMYKSNQILSFCLSPILQTLVYGELLGEKEWLCTCKSNWSASHTRGLCHSSEC